MKFALKYPDTPLYDGNVTPENIARDDRFVPCAVCGELTNYTESFYGTWVCSQECLYELYKGLFPENAAKIKAIMESEEGQWYEGA